MEMQGTCIFWIFYELIFREKDNFQVFPASRVSGYKGKRQVDW